MAGSQLPVPVRGKVAVQRARQEVEWVEDPDLHTLQARSQWSASALSVLTGGGGHLYVGDTAKGIGLIAAAAGALALGAVLPGAIAALPFLGVGVFAAIESWRKARAINRYLAAVREDYDQTSPHPAAYRLLAAMSQVDANAAREAMAAQHKALPAASEVVSDVPGQGQTQGEGAPTVHAQLVERLRKLHTLLGSGVIEVHEYRERKIDLFSKSASAVARDDIDDMLFELLPLRDEGLIDDDDVAFIKELGES